MVHPLFTDLTLFQLLGPPISDFRFPSPDFSISWFIANPWPKGPRWDFPARPVNSFVARPSSPVDLHWSLLFVSSIVNWVHGEYIASRYNLFTPLNDDKIAFPPQSQSLRLFSFPIADFKLPPYKSGDLNDHLD